MKAMDIGYSIAQKHFEKQSSFNKAAYYQGIKVAQELEAQGELPAAPDESMLSKALPYLGAAGAGAAGLYGGQKLYDYITGPEEEEEQPPQEEEANMASYPEMYDMPMEQAPEAYGAYDDYGGYDDYGAYDYYSPYDQYGAYDAYGY